MLVYAAELKAVRQRNVGSARLRGSWLVDQVPIDYARVAVNSIAAARRLRSREHLFAAKGEINPFCDLPRHSGPVRRDRRRVVRARPRRAPSARPGAWGRSSCSLVQATAPTRAPYLYYMLLVMPGIYMVTARLLSPSRVPRRATVGWVVALMYGFIDLYPVPQPQRPLNADSAPWACCQVDDGGRRSVSVSVFVVVSVVVRITGVVTKVRIVRGGAGAGDRGASGSVEVVVTTVAGPVLVTGETSGAVFGGRRGHRGGGQRRLPARPRPRRRRGDRCGLQDRRDAPSSSPRR